MGQGICMGRRVNGAAHDGVGGGADHERNPLTHRGVGSAEDQIPPRDWSQKTSNRPQGEVYVVCGGFSRKVGDWLGGCCRHKTGKFV